MPWTKFSKEQPGATLLLPGRGRRQPGKRPAGQEGAERPGRGRQAGKGLAPSFRTAPWTKALEKAARLRAAEDPFSLLTRALFGCYLLEKAFLGVSWSGAPALNLPWWELN